MVYGWERKKHIRFVSTENLYTFGTLSVSIERERKNERERKKQELEI